ncbi:MAG TPA: 2OG-Fe(II) oxygenase [Methylophilaceae bacterium]|jgi:SM-20-related protein
MHVISQTEQAIDDIARNGYAIIEQFLPAEIISSLADEARGFQSSGLMRKAVTGKSQDSSSDSLRGDFIHWLGNPNSPAQHTYQTAMYELSAVLNRSLYLGLFEFETHFAIYPAGKGYAKHLDQLKGSQERQVSTILYLSQNWQSTDGGELRLYLDEETHQDISPHSGKLVVFLSDRFWHEVLPANRERISLTGWFRKRGSRLP